MKFTRLARRGAFATILAGTVPLVHALGIPVIDIANVQQSALMTAEAVAQTLKQIEQYKTQLAQFENELQNSAAPAAYIWDEAQVTIGSLMEAINTLDGYRRQAGSLDAYLAKFQDVNYYRASPCYSAGGCTDAQRAALEDNRRLASESQKKANDAMVRGLDQQQTNLTRDAATLKRLQGGAQGAQGRMEALAYANQLAGEQAHQLLQIRAMLIAQQNAMAAKMQADADLEAQQEAAELKLTESRYKKSSERAW